MSEDHDTQDRRPIATRNLPASRAVAGFLAGRGISANAISVAGMVSGLAAGAVLALTATGHGPARLWWILGAVLVQLRLLANMLDGMVAIESGTASRTGELYNEIPDRVSDSATLIGLGYAANANPTLGYLAACAALFVAYIRAIGKAAGAHQEFCGPLAKPQRMFLVTVTSLWCGLTPLAWQSFPSIGVPALVLAMLVLGTLFTAVRRLRRIGAALPHAT